MPDGISMAAVVTLDLFDHCDETIHVDVPPVDETVDITPACVRCSPGRPTAP